MRFLDYFYDISAIPRGSGNMKAISSFCYDFAVSRGLEAVKDDYDNVIIYKKATNGREGDAPVVIQAHLDMVAEKKSNSDHDFEKDGLQLIEKDGFLYAKDTTLGADDGIGVAYALAVLASDDISHPALTVVFTTDEETGMDGAKNLDKSLIRGRQLINIDNDVEGTIFTGSAGGRTLCCTIPVKYCMVEGKTAEITISGLKGGHSGSEIHKERGNANIIMGRVLKSILDIVDIHLVEIKGGSKENAIPRECSAVIAVSEGDYAAIEDIISALDKELKKEFSITDENITLSISDKGHNTVRAMFKEDAISVVRFLCLAPNGVYSRTEKPADMVETSSNLGVIYSDDVAVNILLSVRSMSGIRKNILTEKITLLLNLCGGFENIKGDYPQWEYRADSKLQRVFEECYNKQTGKKINRTAIHAGLECGYFAGYDSEFDIISMGPDIFDIHTTEERLDIASAERTFELLKEVLKNL